MWQHPEGWWVGSEVYVVFQYGAPRSMTVTKIGRRWITIEANNHVERFDTATMALDGKGFAPPGQAYLSEACYRDTLEVNKAWSNFVRRLCHTPPDHIIMSEIDLLNSTVFPEDTP